MTETIISLYVIIDFFNDFLRFKEFIINLSTQFIINIFDC